MKTVETRSRAFIPAKFARNTIPRALSSFPARARIVSAFAELHLPPSLSLPAPATTSTDPSTDVARNGQKSGLIAIPITQITREQAEKEGGGRGEGGGAPVYAMPTVSLRRYGTTTTTKIGREGGGEGAWGASAIRHLPFHYNCPRPGDTVSRHAIARSISPRRRYIPIRPGESEIARRRSLRSLTRRDEPRRGNLAEGSGSPVSRLRVRLGLGMRV